MKYTIEGDNLPVVTCMMEMGESMITQNGGMCWMTPNMQMSTGAGGSVGKAFGRMFSGESIFMNTYTAVGSKGLVAFSTRLPGKIMPFAISPGNTIVAQKGAFLASEPGVNLSVHFNHRASTGFFGGEGFVMQKLSGNGTAFLEIDGHCVEYTLAQGQALVVGTGHIAAMTESVTMTVESVKGFTNMFFGGEGFFNTRVTGPGKVWLQGMPLCNLTSMISTKN